MKEIDEMYVHKFRTPELMVVDEQELEEDRAYLRSAWMRSATSCCMRCHLRTMVLFHGSL